MKALLFRRVRQVVPLILAVIVLNFVLIQLAPGSFLDVMSSDAQITDPVMIERMRATYGMDQPAYVQLAKYIGSVATLDLGYSYRQNMPVLNAILSRLPATLLLMFTSIALAFAAGSAAGVLAAARVRTAWDNTVSTIALLFFAAPGFWLGFMLSIVFSVYLGWLPVGGMRTVGAATSGWAGAVDVARHLTLPAISLGLFYAATYTRVMRASVLEVARLDFVRAARARGLRGSQVLWRHTVRNALLPVVTLLGLQLGTVLGGAISVEAVFGWPGIGSLLLDSVMSRDYPVVLGIMVLSSVFTLLVNTLVDLAYLRLDPRILAR